MNLRRSQLLSGIRIADNENDETILKNKLEKLNIYGEIKTI